MGEDFVTRRDRWSTGKADCRAFSRLVAIQLLRNKVLKM